MKQMHGGSGSTDHGGPPITSRAIRRWASIAGVIALHVTVACSPYGPCVLDRIHVAFPATIRVGDAEEAWELRGEVGATNLDRPTYERLTDALIEDASSAAGVVWTLEVTSGAEDGFLAVLLGADPAEGDVLTVGGAFDGGGWGFLAAPSPGPRLAARIGMFVATAASGNFSVLATRPLRLSADVTVADAEGVGYRLVGEMVFSRVIEPVLCD
jgi:hypothetical protein